MSALSDDIKYGARLLRRSPGFSAAAILALALGIGANTAIFSVVDAVLLAKLPYTDGDRLVMVWEDASHMGFPRNTPAPANWVDWRAQNTVFTDIAATRGRTASITGDGPPEQVFGRSVTGNLWTVLGVRPALGRVFSEAEEKAGTPLVVISYGLWQRRYAGDGGIIGRKILLSGKPYTVTAVMPRGFSLMNRASDVWTPAAFTPAELARRGSHFLQCVARLKPGVTLQQAQAEMTIIAQRLEKQYPTTTGRWGCVLIPMREQMVGDTRVILIALLCAAGCVLLIACANIANLLMARGSERHREMAVRAALGAGGRRLVRQLLTESLLLSVLGAAAGLGVAAAGMRLLEKMIPQPMAEVSLSLDSRLLLFTLGVSLLTGVLFGVFPALAGTRMDLHDALKQGGRGQAGGRRQWLRDGLVLTQVSLAPVLLTGASLMMQTLYRLQQVDLGIRTDHVLTLQTFLPDSRYPNHARREALFSTVLDKVRSLPGVVNAGYTSNLPAHYDGQYERVPGPRPAGVAGTGRAVPRRHTGVSGDHGCTSARGPVLHSRRPRRREAGCHHQRDVRESALSGPERSRQGDPDQSPRSRRSVAGDCRCGERGTRAGNRYQYQARNLMPHAQAAGEWPVPDSLAIRTSTDPLAVASAVRQVIWSVDREQPVSRLRTMDEIAAEQVSDRKQAMTLLAIFAGLALVLAIIGIYGVLSYTVMQRSREIAVRMAMGARPAQVLTMVAGRGLTLTAAGLVIGALGALAATRLIRTLLFQVPVRDPWTISAACILLTAVAFAACMVPARRASRIDPAIALRND